MSKQTARKKPTGRVRATPKHTTRRLQIPKRSWRQPRSWFYRPPKPIYAPLSKSRLLLRQSVQLLWQRKRSFFGIALIYGIANLVFVRGFTDLQNLAIIRETVTSGKLTSLFTQLGYLFSTTGSGSGASSGMYQMILLVLCSLAIIWGIRQTYAGRSFTTKETFYEGMYPLVPFLLLLILMSIELIPMSIAGFVYSSFIGGSIAVTGLEKTFTIAVIIGLILWSLRMIISLIFAIYVVTLPGMTPLRAIRSVKGLLYRRRMLVWRKIIYLPVILFLAILLVEIPAIMFATLLAPWLFFILIALAIPLMHAYTYTLYRELISDGK